MNHARRSGGFAYIAAIVFLVVLAGLALALLRLQSTQQATIDASVLGMRAGQAARGALEWGLYQLRSGDPKDCTANDGKTLGDFVADTGFKVTLACKAQSFGEGQADDAPLTKNIFVLEATACNGTASACPDAGSVARAGYVERKRSVSFCMLPGAGPC